jgi:hypothetical protein
MQQVENDIRIIKNAMIAHNADDKGQFESINEKLDASHDIHVRNEEILKSIFAQTQKTNGRVTSLEEYVTRLDKGNALLHQIVSQQHNQYEKWVIQQEKLKDKDDIEFATKEELAPVKKIVYGGVSIILVAFLGTLVSLAFIHYGK